MSVYLISTVKFSLQSLNLSPSNNLSHRTSSWVGVRVASQGQGNFILRRRRRCMVEERRRYVEEGEEWQERGEEE